MSIPHYKLLRDGEANNMEPFAFAWIEPRSIAWLIRPDEHLSPRLEQIISFNCIMQGGYFNVLIPLTDRDTLAPGYDSFLSDYDPDLIVLPPEMDPQALDTFPTSIQPFGMIPWDSVDKIAALDPSKGDQNQNATVHPDQVLQHVKNLPLKTVLAVSRPGLPDTSRLALVACGDAPLLDRQFLIAPNGTRYVDPPGYREQFLHEALTSYRPTNSPHAGAPNWKNLPAQAPKRDVLANQLPPFLQFPLTDAVRMVETCWALQQFSAERPLERPSFLGATALHKGRNDRSRPTRISDGNYWPGMFILVSDSFGYEETILFWNLRATGNYVAWLSFIDLGNHLNEVAEWFEIPSGGQYYSRLARSAFAALATSDAELPRLDQIVTQLRSKLVHGNFHLSDTLSYQQLITYDYERPALQAYERVLVTSFGARCSFTPHLPVDHITGTYRVTLEWDDLRLPQHTRLQALLSPDQPVFSQSFNLISHQGRTPTIQRQLPMSQLRITGKKLLATQVSAQDPIEFKKPTPEMVIETLFTAAGYSRLQESSAAKYHATFIQRAGGLKQAAKYLGDSRYYDLLKLLADNSKPPKGMQPTKLGWVLPYPDERRTLHHLHLREALGKPTPLNTSDYFAKVCDELPEEAIELLEKGLLERGFLLRCSFCSYGSWYPAQHVGQRFECARCSESQVVTSNPAWLYKLPEVIYQGLVEDMHVPLLSLHYLQEKSWQFESIADSDIYWPKNAGTEQHRNIDLICLRNGGLYIGEAKSNNVIESQQFSFYKNVCKQVPVEGLIFATSQAAWSPGTHQRIDDLKNSFAGEILILTEKDLYPSASVP